MRVSASKLPATLDEPRRNHVSQQPTPVVAFRPEGVFHAVCMILLIGSHLAC